MDEVSSQVEGVDDEMAVFSVEKNRGYTMMSKHHLRNKYLSLKAKGLLSLPEDWNYTLKGLSLINREGIDAIRTAVWELEKAGYITRQQNRNSKGKMADMHKESKSYFCDKFCAGIFQYWNNIRERFLIILNDYMV